MLTYNNRLDVSFKNTMDIHAFYQYLSGPNGPVDFDYIIRSPDILSHLNERKYVTFVVDGSMSSMLTRINVATNCQASSKSALSRQRRRLNSTVSHIKLMQNGRRPSGDLKAMLFMQRFITKKTREPSGSSPGAAPLAELSGL